MEKYYPKVLVISHNVLEETNNVGKTILSFFKGWPKEKLYSLYFRKENPVSKVCQEYYRIDDKSVLSSWMKNDKKCGEIVVQEEIDNNIGLSEGDYASYRLGNKRIPLVSFIRDKVWQKGSWKNECLENWINKVNPEIIFFVPNDYELAFFVLKHLNMIKPKVPIITFYTDDAFYFNQRCVGIEYIRRKNLRKLGEYVSRVSSCTFTTCKKMSKEYAKYYNSKYYEIGNSISTKDVEDTNEIVDNSELRLSYIGNLHSNRWKNVLDIGKAVEQLINSGINAKLYVFSGSDMPDSIMKKIKRCKGISWQGRIDNQQVKKEQRIADILVHVEAFDNKSKKSTRLSISTKIFEYLFAGKIILGYGPDDVASMEYLVELDYSAICSSKDELKNTLMDICNNYEVYSKRANKSIQYAKDNFAQENIADKFYNIVYNVYRKEEDVHVDAHK